MLTAMFFLRLDRLPDNSVIHKQYRKPNMEPVIPGS